MLLTILTWTSIIAGGLLILMMLLSLIGGLDLDLDVGDTDVEVDSSGSLGLVKSFLTFVTVSTWVMKIVLAGEFNMFVAGAIGLVSGFVAVAMLSWLFKMLLKNQTNVNWKIEDSLFQEGKVYLRIPASGQTGIVQLNLNGAMRELKASSADGKKIDTGQLVIVQEIKGNTVVVSKAK